MDQLLDTGVKRDRLWQGKDGIRNALGIPETEVISSVDFILKTGNSNVVECGGGDFETISELAKLYPKNHYVVVEPEVRTHPGNSEIAIIPKPVEFLTESDIPSNSADLVFSGGYVFNYVKEKIAFIQQMYRVLKPDASGYIQMRGMPLTPALDVIFPQQFQKGIFEISTHMPAEFVLHIQKRGIEGLVIPAYTYDLQETGNFANDFHMSVSFDQ